MSLLVTWAVFLIVAFGTLVKGGTPITAETVAAAVLGGAVMACCASLLCRVVEKLL